LNPSIGIWFYNKAGIIMRESKVGDLVLIQRCWYSTLSVKPMSQIQAAPQTTAGFMCNLAYNFTAAFTRRWRGGKAAKKQNNSRQKEAEEQIDDTQEEGLNAEPAGLW
jgi:hypothetical protein